MIAQALVNIFLISKEKQQNIQFLLGLEIGFCCWLFPHLFFFLISKTQRTLCQLSLLFSFQLFHRTLVPFHYVLSVNYLLYLISKFCPVLLNQFPLLLLNEKGFFLFFFCSLGSTESQPRGHFLSFCFHLGYYVSWHTGEIKIRKDERNLIINT